LERLTSLYLLDLTGCNQLSDLSPLLNLTSLQVLGLTGCQLIVLDQNWALEGHLRHLRSKKDPTAAPGALAGPISKR
jgi:hypothetical protein